VAHLVDCMIRNLQRFIEYDLGPLVRWDQVRITVPADSENAAVVASFTLDGKLFYIRVDSSELRPPLGQITVDDIERGVIDEQTWTEIAIEIKAWHAGRIHKRSNGHDQDEGSVIWLTPQHPTTA
jgi:hypothetical protein